MGGHERWGTVQEMRSWAKEDGGVPPGEKVYKLSVAA